MSFKMQKIYSVGSNGRSEFNLWQQHKELKTMEMSEVRSVIFDDVYIHKF